MSARRRQNQAKKSPNKRTLSEVRIIGGQFKRQLVPFIDAEGLRPSPDRLRETLFNWIQFECHDAVVLDLCAGSGVLGLEVLSRGAQHVTCIELQPKQAQLITSTAEKLKITTEQLEVLTGDALQIIPRISTDNNITPFHIVFVDPPYDLELWTHLLTTLIQNNLVSSNTLFYIEDRRPLNETLAAFDKTYDILKQTKIGQIFASLIQIDM